MLQLDLAKSLQGATGPLALRFQADVAWGECLALHGPSGAGKTSVLRMVAGFLAPDAGHITLDGQPWQQGRTVLPPQARRCGLVFQQYALFPRMRVREQLRYAQAQHDEAAIDHLLQALDLSAIAGQLPGQLSGGQQQRLAFARALAARPQVLLLDEPFSAQDAAHADAMRALLHAYRTDNRCICLLVTHAIADAFQLADRVALMDQGAVLAIDRPAAVFGGELSAEVVRLEADGTHWRMALLVNGRLSPQTLPIADFPALKVGDRLPIRLQF